MKNLNKYSVYMLAYALWAVCVAVCFWVILRLRDAILSLIVVASLDLYEAGAQERLDTAMRVRASDAWSYLFVGLTIIIAIVVLEHVFRIGAQQGQVWSRFSLVLGIELGILFLSELALALSESAVRSVSWADFIAPLVYLVPTVLLAWLWLSIRQNPSAA